MKLYRYAIRFKALNKGILPRFTGHIIRGVFGQSLYELDQNLYQILFEKQLLVEQFGNSQYPSPFVIHAHNPPDGQVKMHDSIDFILTLFGDYHRYIARLQPVFERMAQTGLNRGTIKLSYEKTQALHFGNSGKSAIDINDFKAAKTKDNLLRIKFQSPLDIDIKGDLTYDFFARQLINRLTNLQQYFGSGKLGFEKEAAQLTAELYSVNMYKIIINHKHISGQEYKIPAWLGEIVFYDRRQFQDLYPLWQFGQYCHLGIRTPEVSANTVC